jgi:hypothetical protein
LLQAELIKEPKWLVVGPATGQCKIKSIIVSKIAWRIFAVNYRLDKVCSTVKSAIIPFPRRVGELFKVFVCVLNVKASEINGTVTWHCLIAEAVKIVNYVKVDAKAGSMLITVY